MADGKWCTALRTPSLALMLACTNEIPTFPHFLTMSIWLCSSLSVPSPVTSSISFTTLLHVILFISVDFDSYFYLLAESDQSLNFDMTFDKKKKKKSQTYCSYIILSESKIQPQVINKFIFLWVLNWNFPKKASGKWCEGNHTFWMLPLYTALQQNKILICTFCLSLNHSSSPPQRKEKDAHKELERKKTTPQFPYTTGNVCKKFIRVLNNISWCLAGTISCISIWLI